MFRFALPWEDTSLLFTPQWSGVLAPTVQAVVIALLCVIPIALVLWLYRYELQLVTRGTALSLLSLRLVALTLLLFLVCLQPVYARERKTGLPGKVLIAVDRSDSMNVADPQREPAEKLRLARALKLVGDAISDAQLTRWIEDHEASKPPRWLSEEESRDLEPARRRELERERRQAHDDLLKRIDELTRTQAQRRILGPEGVALVQAIAARHEVELIGFHRESWDVKGGAIDELFVQPTDAAAREAAASGASAFTDLRLPLNRALERSGPGQGAVLGVVLLTDGQHNQGDPPVAKASELGERKVPVFPIALGTRKPPPDLAVASVRAPHAVFKDVDAPVEVHFKATGLAPQDLIIDLHLAGVEKKLLDSKTIRHDGKDQEYVQRFPVRLDLVGTQTLLASVRATDPAVKETRPDNNSRVTVMNVADDRAKVLLVDGEARWEHHYLATALRRDRTMQVTDVVFDQPRLDEKLSPADLQKMGMPRQSLPSEPDALAEYDCIILGDVTPAQLPPEDRVRLEKYVADRGGTLVVVAGKRSMPLAFPGDEGDPLRKLLPIEEPAVVAPRNGFALSLTEPGKETKFLELDPDPALSLRRWSELPRHFWAVAGRVKPGATSLAWLKDKDDKSTQTEREREQAVIARHSYGFGRVLFVGLDSTWRWRFKVGDTYHHRLWGQAIRWAAADKPLVTGNAFVRFGTPQPVYRQGQEIELVARIAEEAGPLKADLLAGARLLRLDDTTKKEDAVALVPLARRPAQPRVLEGKVRDLPPGRYAIELVAPDLADKLRGPDGSTPLRAGFTLTAPDSLETIDLGTRYPLLEELAVKSGGKLFTSEDAPALVELLTAKSVPHIEYHEQRLWQWWVLLALVLGLLTLEWAGRKLAGLP